MPRLDDCRVLVTGGTSGIGAEVVRRLASEGARIVFTGRDPARGASVADETGASFVQADVCDPEAIARSVVEAIEVLGGLDALVLNAGVLHEAPLSETSDEAWDAVMDTNLVAPYRYSVACLPHLRASGGLDRRHIFGRGRVARGTDRRLLGLEALPEHARADARNGGR